jgi:hypothetical protein
LTGAIQKIANIFSLCGRGDQIIIGISLCRGLSRKFVRTFRHPPVASIDGRGIGGALPGLLPSA